MVEFVAHDPDPRFGSLNHDPRADLGARHQSVAIYVQGRIRSQADSNLMKAYLATTGMLFAVLALLHVWRLVVEWPVIRAEFWIVAGGSLLSAILALWALKLLLALIRSNRPPSAAE
jgi:hypothetical protein